MIWPLFYLYIMETKGVNFLEQGQLAIFRILWHVRPRKSFLTDLWLREYEGTALFFNLFAHVLPKAQNKYPYFKLYMKNIVFLSPGEHSLYDQGTEEARKLYSQEVEAATGGKNTCDWGKLAALAEDLKAEYRKYFPTTRGLIIGVKYSPEEVHEIVTMLNKKYLAEIKQSNNQKSESHGM